MNKKLTVIFTLAFLAFALINCTKNDTAATNTAAFKTTPVNTSSPSTVNTPADNPQTAQKIALGKLLFWDPVLSGNNDIACATCHHPSTGYSDALDLSIGVNGQGLGITRHFISPNNIPFAKRNSLT